MTSPKDVAGLFTDPRHKLEPLFAEAQKAAEARDADRLGEIMEEIGRIHRKNPSIQVERHRHDIGTIDINRIAMKIISKS
jgi:hypothetical protein